MRAPMLFSPGPVLVEDSVRYSLLHYDICHRGAEFMEMFRDTQVKVNRLFKADSSYYSVIVSGSGTAANETALSSIFAPGDAVLLVSNGVFGERLEEIIATYKVPMFKPHIEWAQYPDVSEVEKTVRDNPSIKVVAMVYHETSTGMINPVNAVGQVCKKYGKIFFVDCVSAAAGEDIDVLRDNIDICTGVAGKCLGGFPGSAYICARESLLMQLNEKHCGNVYLNLSKHYKIAKKTSQTPNTPNVTLFFALNEALTRLLEAEGLEHRLKRYAECAAIIRNGVKSMGLKLLLDEKHMSNTVTSVFLPGNLDVEDFILRMEEEGYVLYPGKGKYLEMGMFQIANMGRIFPQDCNMFLSALKRTIEKMEIEASSKTA